MRSWQQLLALEAFEPGDHGKSLIYEVGPQRFIKFGHLQPHPLAEGNAWSGSLLLSRLKTVLDGSVVLHMVQQGENGVVHSLATRCCLGGPPVSWLLTAGLRCGGHLTGCLAGADTDVIILIVVPLCHCDRWCDRDLPLLAVDGQVWMDGQVGHQELQVAAHPPLPGSQHLGSLAQWRQLLEASVECPHGL